MKVVEQEQAQAAQLVQERVEMGQSRSADR
jgi:hypothetical protein